MNPNWAVAHYQGARTPPVMAEARTPSVDWLEHQDLSNQPRQQVQVREITQHQHQHQRLVGCYRMGSLKVYYARSHGGIKEK